MSDWDNWNEVRLLVKEKLEQQNEMINEIRDNMKWLMRIVIGAVIVGLMNVLLNASTWMGKH